MSTVHVLLSSLQDRARCSIESCRTMLVKLLALCRYDEHKSEVVASGADTLLALANDDALMTAETIEALLELLNALMLDNHAARMQLVRKGVLHVALSALGNYVPNKPSKQRNKVVCIALEVVNQWSRCCSSNSMNSAEDSSLSECQEAAVMHILRTLDSTFEDANVLLHAAEVLGCLLERNSESIACVTQLDGIAILLRLLLTPDDFMDVKQSACEALLVMSDAPGLVQQLVAHNVIHALGVCLCAPIPNRDVDSLATRLLLRVTSEAHVDGQVIHETMLPLLFGVVERNGTVLGVVAPACAILERLSRFARDCKLDLAPFVQAPVCRSRPLLAAANSHAHVAGVVRSVFQFFVNVAFNTVDLPLLINAEALEGLLALYILHGGGGGSLASLSADVVQIMSSLSRSTIEALVLQDDDKSLPALFLCLRAHYENLRFASQVFAVLTKYWRVQAKSVHSITGFVGIAVDVLCRYASTTLVTCDEMMEVYNFVRVVLESKDGIEVVLSCGGRALADALRVLAAMSTLSPSELQQQQLCTTVLVASQSASGSVERIIGALALRLESAVGASDRTNLAPSSPMQAARRIREGDSEYEAFVARILRQEGSCQFKAFETDALKPSVSGSINIVEPLHGAASSSSADATTGGAGSSAVGLHRSIAVDDSDASDASGSASADDNGDNDNTVADDDDDDAEAENDGNGNDDSDADGSNDDDDAVVDIALDYIALGDASDDDALTAMCNDERGIVAAMTESASAHTSGDAKPSPSKPFNITGWSTSADGAQLTDQPHCYVSPLGIAFPKHPSRTATACLLDNDSDDSDVADIFANCEPCYMPSSDAMSAFIEQANARRAAFVQSDPVTRAQLVYDSKSHFGTLGSTSAATATGERPLPPPPLSSAKPETYPYYVSDKCTGSGVGVGGDTLTFDSCFESGNLARAVQIGEREYDLFLRRDYNTTGHMQWFYFAISNVQPSANGAVASYRFNIVNLCKPDSLFNQGLQPLVYSVKDALEHQRGWRRSGSDVYYFSNPFPRSRNSAGVASKTAAATAMYNSGTSTSTSATTTNNDASPSAALVETYFTLTFTLELANTHDTYLVAHSYPYTLSDHAAHMTRLTRQSHRSLESILRRSTLCKTLGSRDCELLRITDFAASATEQRARRAVVLSSRVHPGEAQASWMMRGAIDFLLGDSDAACVLRRIFVFFVVPMLNPDGVYVGNSRCSLAACDLNRIWHAPSAVYHPTIFHTKELLKHASATRGVVLFCDLHGHSRKKNVFVYGCDTKKRPNPRARAFAKLFATHSAAKSYLSYPDCSFKVSRSKETTARVVVANEFKIPWCFTLEASFCGGSYGPLQDVHYSTRHMRAVGAALCDTLLHASVGGNTGVRERLAAIVDDYSMNVPAYVDSTLRESGAVSDALGAGALARDGSVATPRAKSKSAGNSNGTGTSNSAVRRASDAASKSVSKPVRRTSLSSKSSKALLPPPRMPRQDSHKLERKASNRYPEQHASTPMEQSAVRRDDVASPRTYMLSIAAGGQEFSGAPVRNKVSGKKLRNKKKKVTKRAPLAAAADPAVVAVAAVEPSACDGSAAESMPALHASSRTCDTDASSATRCVPSNNSSSSTNNSNGGVSTSVASNRAHTLVKASTNSPAGKAASSGMHGRSSPIAASLHLADPIPMWKPPVLLDALSLTGPQPRDSAAVILPPPVSDLVTRSPKVKSSSMRFRGAGRQFAAVSSVQSKSLREIMHRTESIQYEAYDHDLLSASAMAIRQRSSSSSDNNALPSTRAAKHALPVAPTSYLSFPSVT